MMRASFYIPETLHQRLLLASKRNKTNISDLARDLLDRGLKHAENQQLDEMYRGLAHLKGFIKDPITDASSTIDEVLYGEHGAWRGHLLDNENQ